MTQETLDEVIRKHKLWLNYEEGGKRAVLISEDLQCLVLRGKDLRNVAMWRVRLDGADLSYSDLRGAEIRHTALRQTDFRGADLQNANLDYSCFPLWCGGSRFKCSSSLVQQLFAHICTLEIVDADDSMRAAIEAIREEAKKSHRAGDLRLRSALLDEEEGRCVL